MSTFTLGSLRIERLTAVSEVPEKYPVAHGRTRGSPESPRIWIESFCPSTLETNSEWRKSGGDLATGGRSVMGMGGSISSSSGGVLAITGGRSAMGSGGLSASGGVSTIAGTGSTMGSGGSAASGGSSSLAASGLADLGGSGGTAQSDQTASANGGTSPATSANSTAGTQAVSRASSTASPGAGCACSVPGVTSKSPLLQYALGIVLGLLAALRRRVRPALP